MEIWIKRFREKWEWNNIVSIVPAPVRHWGFLWKHGESHQEWDCKVQHQTIRGALQKWSMLQQIWVYPMVFCHRWGCLGCLMLWNIRTLHSTEALTWACWTQVEAAPVITYNNMRNQNYFFKHIIYNSIISWKMSQTLVPLFQFSHVIKMLIVIYIYIYI